MKAAVYYEADEAFVHEEVADPALRSGTVLVRNEAISIEGGDELGWVGLVR